MSSYKKNPFVIGVTSTIIQVGFIFTFLTIFFFLYVQKVEKEEFKEQLNIILDYILEKYINDASVILDKQNVNKELEIVITNGIIDVLKEKIIISTEKSALDVIEKNREVKLKALKMLSLFIIISVVICIIILLAGFYIPLVSQIKEAMLVVIFVGLTEFSFLHIIAKKYILADPEKVKQKFSESVRKWLVDNKKI